MNNPILPGSAIGILGGGQLGRMLALAARTMGFRVHNLSPERDSPAGQVSDLEVITPYYNLDQIRFFAAGVSVVTFEFENVPADSAAAAAEQTIVRPKHSVLHTTQHRGREKQFLEGIGVQVARFAHVQTLSELRTAFDEVGFPAILKTATAGYDGKGQYRIDREDDAENAWRSVGKKDAVLESLIEFDKEISVVGARGVDGSFVHYGAIENIHVNHVLDISIAPARIPAETAQRAIEITRKILEELDVVGVLCVEIFITQGGELIVNELAPRPHNSAHLTVDACATSQFEQQLRAVCALPFGSTQLLRPAVMVNLLGDLWSDGEPDWAAALRWSEVNLHLYGKEQASPGRKMGHITVLGDSVEEALEIAMTARASLSRSL
ncbi:MAG TPA: 5-(carboxyamino)imidazole ribonucleotide synthase [Thermoanaerobaculia bacterium]|nr:5-(carboxyamino)imidazole ribonucleotide synthase [Thermoanaerobaculia bacterium]